MDYEDFESAGLTWEELQAIHDNYRGLERKLRGIGKDFVDEYLYDIEKAGIHSYRYRTKEPVSYTHLSFLFRFDTGMKTSTSDIDARFPESAVYRQQQNPIFSISSSGFP